MPDMDKFPYTVRVCLKSPNPTVPLLWLPCAARSGADGRRCADQSCRCGYRNGLVKEGDNYVVLSDILGDEDPWAIWTSKLRVLVTVSLHCRGYQN